MRIKKIKRVIIINQENPHEIIGIVTQATLVNAIRTSVLERTFRPYRVLVREHYKPIAGNLGFLMQFAGVLMISCTSCNVFRRKQICNRNIFSSCSHINNRICIKHIRRKKPPQSKAIINCCCIRFCVIEYFWEFAIYVCKSFLEGH